MTYPKMPGYSLPGTSRDAALSVQRLAASIRSRVMDELLDVYPAGLTRDEIARRLGIAAHRLGPRLAELHNATIRMIEQTGQRRRGESGRMMSVWRATVEEE
ncbi:MULTISPECIES: hypothetical protein [unclassified Bradyrhizobium]|uniref:hypothetical protein n=1 Tax=unclassified Bradyrhizobium TaxID=2631580 RepID=UPI002915F5EA|nr:MULTISPECIES: hypothetical protein [unclassified Bradyrhizobium]